jgi:hypothetical protein
MIITGEILDASSAHAAKRSSPGENQATAPNGRTANWAHHAAAMDCPEGHGKPLEIR